ncbi:hypothetical protein SCP_0507470 [Sparassis crispa]|uniref:Uncharacterized protein n=1 Tax=Sparassis crispa TaxID=139825 RepID=A0A401GN73_9APHY|nr:hypothetical protein SCP_0507470 [Sparassis crispa]GBE83691.1 hypothetical protein SCP_0507470 [Sparassis crispa]
MRRERRFSRYFDEESRWRRSGKICVARIECRKSTEFGASLQTLVRPFLHFTPDTAQGLTTVGVAPAIQVNTADNSDESAAVIAHRIHELPVSHISSLISKQLLFAFYS